MKQTIGIYLMIAGAAIAAAIAAINIAAKVHQDNVSWEQTLTDRVKRQKAAEDEALQGICASYRRWEELTQDRVPGMWARCMSYPIDNAGVSPP